MSEFDLTVYERPRGITYKGISSQREYQLFPEEYFSGADIFIYFNDVLIDEITGLSFVITEDVLPIYTYASYRYKDVARGKRIVEGAFRIAFKENGYLLKVLEHIGQYGFSNPLETIAEQRKSQAYNSKIQYKKGQFKLYEDFEEHINPGGQKSTFSGLVTVDDKTNTIRIKDTASLSKIKKIVYDYVGSGFPSANLSSLKNVINKTKDKCLKQGFIAKTDEEKKAILELKKRLNSYEVITDRMRLVYGNPYILDTSGKNAYVYDSKTAERVKSLQHLIGTSVTGNITLNDIKQLEKGFVVTASKSDILTSFDLPTKELVYRYLKKRGFNQNEVLRYMYYHKEVSYFLSKEMMLDSFTPTGLEQQYAQAELEALKKDEFSVVDYKPFFYSGQYSQKLLKKGFDIYIVYGPLPPFVKANQEKAENPSFNTTVRVIYGVQLTGIKQILAPDGKPVEEYYTFIAKDIG